jgi:RNA polymerase sigma factor (sigma-70 family)
MRTKQQKQGETAKLIEDYIPLAKSICKRYAELDYDDRFQQAALGLCEAAQKFDPTKGSFGAYARRVIKSYLNDFYNDSKSNIKNSISTDWNSVEANSEDSKIPTSFMASNQKSKYELFEVLESVNQSLSEEHYKIAKMITVHTQEEVAKELGISQSTICRRLNDIQTVLNN